MSFYSYQPERVINQLLLIVLPSVGGGVGVGDPPPKGLLRNHSIVPSLATWGSR